MEPALRGSGEGAGAEFDGAGPGEEAADDVGRVELEAAGCKVETAGRGVGVVLEELAEAEEVEGQRVPRRVRGGEVAVAVAVTAPVDDGAVDGTHDPLDRQEQELPPGGREPQVEEPVP